MSNIGPAIGISTPAYVGKPGGAAGPAGWQLIAKTEVVAPATTTPAIDTVGADLFVLVCGSLSATITVSDSAGNTWTQQFLQTFSALQLAIYYVHAPTTSAAHTFTVATTQGNVCVLAYSGSRASPVDQSAFSTVNTPTLAAQPGSITPTANNELLVTARNIYGSAGTLTVDSGFTIQDFTDGVNNVNVGLGVATLVQPTAAAINPTWTRGSFPSGGDILVITSFFG